MKSLDIRELIIIDKSGNSLQLNFHQFDLIIHFYSLLAVQYSFTTVPLWAFEDSVVEFFPVVNDLITLSNFITALF